MNKRQSTIVLASSCNMNECTACPVILGYKVQCRLALTAWTVQTTLNLLRLHGNEKGLWPLDFSHLQRFSQS